MNISIIGAGNTGMALYIHLVTIGLNAMLYTRSTEKKKFYDNNRIAATGVFSGNYQIRSTASLTELLEHSDIVFIATRANAHQEVLEDIYSHKDVNVIILNGNWGACQAVKIKRKYYRESTTEIIESGGMPYIASWDKNNIKISAVKDNVDVASDTGEISEGIRKILNKLFRNISVKHSIYETSITAPNPIIHIPLALFNITRIENKEDFNILVDGFSKRAEKYILEIDNERRLIAEKLGVKYTPILKLLNGYWNYNYSSLEELYISSPIYSNVKAPKGIEHRFITEDMPYGIVPVSTLGRLLGVKTPYSDALITIFKLYYEELDCGDEIGFYNEFA